MSFFPVLDKLFDNAKNIDADSVWVRAVDEEVKREIIRLNTKDQMFDKGVDSLNRSLGVYSPTSVSKYGKRKGRIQLFDTGVFFDSFVIRVDRGGLTISADTQKEDTDLAVRYGIDILGVTPSNTDLLIRTFLLPKYHGIILNDLFKGIE